MPQYVIITDTNVAALYGKLCPSIPLFTVLPGEQSKTLVSAQALSSQMIRSGCDRNTTVIALGGGMITDLAGFVASTFCRGVPLILIPTTLLAMVDASIGGKTAVNLPEGKNLIGSYYFPKQVILHLPFLETLPSAEWENGAVEILKMGLIGDPDLFYNFSHFSTAALIDRAIEGKRRIVAQDSYETGCRSLLNLGHTIGHALETLSNYTLSHGRAVAMGIVLEARLSHAMGLLPQEDLDAIEKGFPSFQLQFSPEQIITALKADKKSKGGIPHFVLLEKIGRPHVMESRFCHPVPISMLREVLALEYF
jgi:3-dehydroquinate synthase